MTPTEWARPAYLPDTIKTEADAAKFVSDHVAFKAAEDSRRLTLPAKPEDYKPQLSKDFKPPQGIEFVPNENDPLLPQARAFAQKHGLSQDAFSELMDLHAAGQIGTRQAIATAQAAEVQKLGVNGTARKTAVDTWLTSIDPALGKHFSEYMFTAQQVEFVEKLMARDRTQGQHGFSNTGREPPAEQGKVSQEQYAKMTNAERLDYARRFPQPAVNGARQ